MKPLSSRSGAGGPRPRGTLRDRQTAALTLTLLAAALPSLAAAQTITQADRQAVAAMALPVPGSTTMAPRGAAPHYFSVANYANSPLRLPAALVTVEGTGTGADALANVDLVTGAITSINLVAGGSGYDPATVTTVTITGAGSGAAASATVDPLTGAVSAITVDAPGAGYVTAGLRKFVDGLPRLGAAGANNLGQYIPVAVPDTTSFADADYYEIAVVEYREKMHSDLPATKLRGYVQLSTALVPGKQVPLANPDGTPILLPSGMQALAVDAPHYLGPIIAATKDRPVRILFRNLLPTGAGGDLFLPVDTTVMGAGMGPAGAGMVEPDPRNPMCGNKRLDPAMRSVCYPENRATLHLHGGLNPWISDGTPHQWTTPANENTPYPKGVSVSNVPDMPDPGPGAITFFYSNQQSARLMFYHDHAWGITRLNVYAGEAAGYLITDPAEQKLVANGLVPAEQIPLVIQDKTFVPPTQQLAQQDPTWDLEFWGSMGDLWVPHVYSPAQNPGDVSGVNQFGRWAYGPWFWPPTNNILYPPVANAYYDPACNPMARWCEPPLMPGTPYLSMGMESFNDTPVVNGTAYPTLTVEPRAYRFRVLNAANDRFFNLSLYQADASGTEVALNAAEVQAALTDPTVFPTPDTVVSPPGPSWVQIGTEGGFLPAPVVIPPQPTTWVTDPTVFNAGNVDKHSLLVGPAERADVIVDFSAFAGKTLIVYNDAPAAFPARDPRYDYYTGSADLTATGGAPSVPAGFGPNTRTVMQIKVAANPPAAPFDVAPLAAAFAHQADGSGVFESSQNPIIVGQGEYNSAYGTAFQSAGPKAGVVQIYDELLQFDALSGTTLTMPLERKAIQDEMGEAFEKDYGRMSGNLGLEAPNAQPGMLQTLILYPFINPASEILDGISLPPGVSVSPITSATDGTQLWKITHNGVDTHPIHFHLFDVQLLNRVGWDGIIRKPDANELGWKDTVRISPLEDTIVALRPIMPKLPFGLPDSIRPLNPMAPIGDPDGFNSTDALGNPMVPAITNQLANFGHEYVWHCHILSHEEMDMMRPMAVNVAASVPGVPTAAATVDPLTSAATITWSDPTPVTTIATWGDPANEIGFRVERAEVLKNGKLGAWTVVGTTLANQTGFVDTTALVGTTYVYRVVAYNVAGATVSATLGGAATTIPVAPTNPIATLVNGPAVSFTWKDGSNNESFFVVERSVDGGAFTMLAQPPANAQSYSDTAVTVGRAYQYRVAAVNSAGWSTYATSGTVMPVAPPAAPSGLTGTVAVQGKKANVTTTWLDNSLDETGFELQRATNAGFTVGLTTQPLAANTVTVTQTSLFRGVTYFYRIRAVNSGGASAWSNVFSIVTP